MEAVRGDTGDSIGLAGLAPEGEPDRTGEPVDLTIVGRSAAAGLDREFNRDDGRRVAIALGSDSLTTDGRNKIRPGIEIPGGRSPGKFGRSQAARSGAFPRTRQELLDLLRRTVIVGISNDEAAGPSWRGPVRVRSIVGHCGISSREGWTAGPTVPKPDVGEQRQNSVARPDESSDPALSPAVP